MTKPVAITLTQQLWWLVGTLALVGAAVCLHEAYWLLIETADAIRRRLTRLRHD
jgi:hypothetical protein